MPVQIFVDTEFASLLDPLVWSIGLVTVDCRECYVELDRDSEVGRVRIAATPWDVREGVLDKFGLISDSACESESAMGHRIGDWLRRVAESSPDGRAEILYDYGLDYELLVGVLEESGVWHEVRPLVSARNVAAEISARDSRLASEATYQALRLRTPPLYRHHALGDAYALRASWRTSYLRQHRPKDFARLLSVAGAARESWLSAWLATPTLALRGRTPLDTLDDAAGLQLVVDALLAYTDAEGA